MKPFLTTMIRVLAGAVAGFAMAMIFVRLTADAGFHPAAVPSRSETRQAGSADACSAPLAALPAAGTFLTLSSREKLACSAGLARLSSEQRQALLQDCLQRGEPERTILLRLLLAQWAAADPAAAAEWTLAHVQGEALQKCLDDLTRVWASRDGEALAHWADNWIRKNPGDSANLIRGAAMEALATHDPFQQASMAEMECNRNWGWRGVDAARFLSTAEAAKAMAQRLEGHVAYIDDLEKLQKILTLGYGNPNIRTKNLFNQLFEETALAWHRMDPAGCNQWLSGWPENARLAARYVIGKTEEKEKAVSAQAQAPAPTPDPSSAPGETEEAGPESALPASLILPEAAPPATADATAAQLSAWSQWWHRDAPEAEAFLNTAAWSEDLKFRARAKAYSSTP